jgi:2,4-didehydro-3-deoxy-L-rhamnonate hydrolase
MPAANEIFASSTSKRFALGQFRLGPRDSPVFLGLVRGETVRDLSGIAPLRDRVGGGPVTMSSVLEAWDACLPVLADLDGGELPVGSLTVLPPVQPRQILQAGMNYRAHVIDLAAAHHNGADGGSVEQVRADAAAMMDERTRTGLPFLFTGHATALAGPYDDLVLPGYSDQHDWELELAVVIGRRAFRVDRAAAKDHVAGYTIVNDITTRDLVFRGEPRGGMDWFRAKNAPGFLPLGPYLVPARFVDDPMDLRLTLSLNGDVMQDESTKDMLFDIATQITTAAQITPLLPGDLLLTGSPAGNGMHHGRLLRPGDVMTATITGLGEQRVRCIDEAGTTAERA